VNLCRTLSWWHFSVVAVDHLRTKLWHVAVFVKVVSEVINSVALSVIMRLTFYFSSDSARYSITNSQYVPHMMRVLDV